MNFLNHMLAILSNPAVISVVAMVVEAGLRLIPSTKPASILYAASSGLKLIAQGVDALAGFVDKVLPQNLRPVADVSSIVPPNPPAS